MLSITLFWQTDYRWRYQSMDGINLWSLILVVASVNPLMSDRARQAQGIYIMAFKHLFGVGLQNTLSLPRKRQIGRKSFMFGRKAREWEKKKLAYVHKFSLQRSIIAPWFNAPFTLITSPYFHYLSTLSLWMIAINSSISCYHYHSHHIHDIMF